MTTRTRKPDIAVAIFESTLTKSTKLQRFAKHSRTFRKNQNNKLKKVQWIIKRVDNNLLRKMRKNIVVTKTAAILFYNLILMNVDFIIVQSF